MDGWMDGFEEDRILLESNHKEKYYQYFVLNSACVYFANTSHKSTVCKTVLEIICCYIPISLEALSP